MGTLVLQVLAYSAVGIAILAAAFLVIDIVTGRGGGHTRLGQLVADGNAGAGVLAASTVASLGLVMFFAIHYTGAGWGALDNCAVFGAVAVAIQAASYVVFDLIIPGHLGDRCFATPGGASEGKAPPAALAAAGWQVAVALVISASLT